MTDTLDIKISKAKKKLPEMSRNSIDTVNWRVVILSMANRYNQDQLDALETETELLLCGITAINDFPKELEKRMMVSKNEVSLILKELDEKVFKKIQEELERRIGITGEKEIIYKSKGLNFDPRFNELPKDLQEAIACSDWKNKIYDIAKRYKINIEQTGILEEITSRLILNKVNGGQYDAELKTKITIPEDKIKEVVSEINESVLKNIKEILRINSTKEKKDGVPLPPYEKANQDVPPPPPYMKIPSIPTVETPKKIELSTNLKGEDKDIYKEEGIEIIPNSESSDELKNEDVAVNILSDKMLSQTSSKIITSNYYSTPKPSVQNDISELSLQEDSQLKHHDPYHEEI